MEAIAWGLIAAPLMIAICGLQLFFPRHIEIRRNWIQVTHGQSAVRVKSERIRRIEVVGSWPEEQRLILEYVTTRGKDRTLDCVVGSSVNQEALKALVASLAAAATRGGPDVQI